MSEKITYACITQNRIKSIQRNIPKVIDYVDKIVIVDGFSIDGTKEWLENYNSDKITVVSRRWDDSFANQYNEYLKYVDGGWVLICDDDEIPSEILLKSLRPLVNASGGGEMYNIIEFKSHPLESDKDGKILCDNGSPDYWRQIFFKYYPGTHYSIDLHQALRSPVRGKVLRRNETYYHVKTDEDGYRNACRNWWIAGVWDDDVNDGYQPPEWHEFRKIVLNVHPHIGVFNHFNEVLLRGNMAQSIKDYIIKVKDIPDEGSRRKFHELRSFYKYYFDVLHPEEKIEKVNPFTVEDVHDIAALKGAGHNSKELAWILNEMIKIQPHVIVEIGIYQGGGTYFWEKVLRDPSDMLIGIDCAMRPFSWDINTMIAKWIP